MLAIIESRIDNDPEEELKIVSDLEVRARSATQRLSDRVRQCAAEPECISSELTKDAVRFAVLIVLNPTSTPPTIPT